MRLGDYCRGEPGFLLLPLEHLSPTGSDADLAAFLLDDCGWSRGRLALLDASLALYWSRATRLARRTTTWPGPRIRNVGIAVDALAIRPYAQVLNTSTWTLYDCDLDPQRSHPELVAHLLVLGDFMSMTGEVSEAAMRSAAWWLEADDEACAAFARAAALSQRPDGDTGRAVADALPWLRTLRHRRLRPAQPAGDHREIPATGLLVPAALESKPPALVDACRSAAVAALEGFRREWPKAQAGAVASLAAWLERERPMVVVTAASGATLWDRVDPGATTEISSCLARADAVALESIRGDLSAIDARSRAFLARLSDADSLPRPDGALGQAGYAYMHPHRRTIAYNLQERGMERLSGPPLPYERAMLGARTLHEWAHLADAAGWVPARVDDAELAARRTRLAEELEAVLAECAPAARDHARRDLDEICRGGPPGEALADLLLTRLPDYRANLVAGPLMTQAESETYARHNIRTLRYEYPAAKLWRMIVRYLYEYQYLLPQIGLSAVDDAYRYFTAATGFHADVVAAGVLSEERFHAVSAALTSVCCAYGVDRARIRCSLA